MGGNQETMDAEINFAADAGLDYWALVMYPEQDSMSRAIQLYLESKRSDAIKFCIILHNNLGVLGSVGKVKMSFLKYNIVSFLLILVFSSTRSLYILPPFIT